MSEMKREEALQEIGNIIAHWIEWTERERETECLETTSDTHVMLDGYTNAPPSWPTVGQLRLWLKVLHDHPNKAEEDQ